MKKKRRSGESVRRSKVKEDTIHRVSGVYYPSEDNLVPPVGTIEYARFGRSLFSSLSLAPGFLPRPVSFFFSHLCPFSL